MKLLVTISCLGLFSTQLRETLTKNCRSSLNKLLCGPQHISRFFWTRELLQASTFRVILPVRTTSVRGVDTACCHKKYVFFSFQNSSTFYESYLSAMFFCSKSYVLRFFQMTRTRYSGHFVINKLLSFLYT